MIIRLSALAAVLVLSASCGGDRNPSQAEIDAAVAKALDTTTTHAPPTIETVPPTTAASPLPTAATRSPAGPATAGVKPTTSTTALPRSQSAIPTSTAPVPTTTTMAAPVPKVLLSKSGQGYTRMNKYSSQAPEYGFITPRSPKLKIEWTTSGASSYHKLDTAGGETMIAEQASLEVSIEGKIAAQNNQNQQTGSQTWAPQSGSVIIPTTAGALQEVKIRASYNCSWTVKITEVY